MTDTESDHTTLRGTVKSVLIVKDLPTEPSLLNRRSEHIVFAKTHNPPSIQNSASSKRYSNSLNSSSEFTEKNTAQFVIKDAKATRVFAKREVTENKENVSSLINREIKVWKSKTIKNNPEGSERRKISEFYEGK